MKLFEHEGKELLRIFGIKVPKRLALLDENLDKDEVPGFDYPVVVKAQVLSGKRGKRGLVKKVETEADLLRFLDRVLGKNFDNEVVGQVLVEEAVEIDQELFVAVTYSTKRRGLVLLIGEGGMEVEADRRVMETPIKIWTKNGKTEFDYLKENEWLRKSDELRVVVERLIKLTIEKDLFLVEINPLGLTTKGGWMALDAKLVADEAAFYRQKWDLPERNMMGRTKTKAEMAAEKIDADDHRGVVGRVYLDLEGDIGVLAAGGGASLVAMDALVDWGLAPANYTEFSGNPPKEKIAKLTEIVLGKKGLKGAILIGGKANFTDQYETLSGFLEAVEKINPKYPLVVRRDGPRMKEAKELLEKRAKERGWRMEVYDARISIGEAVQKLKEMVDGKKE